MAKRGVAMQKSFITTLFWQFQLQKHGLWSGPTAPTLAASSKLTLEPLENP